jgi:hypothetical protein
MSELSFIEKTKIEKLLGMGSGYVLDFSNQKFQEFVAESVGLNIFDKKYDYLSGSKANRLRALWNVEPNHLVGKVIHDLVEYARQSPSNEFDSHFSDCSRIAERLRQGAPVLDMLGTGAELGERAFQALVKSLRHAIDNNEPEAALDRLHTYVVKYMRSLCQRRGIDVSRDKPLHSLVGEYIKHAKAGGFIESEMTERILKSSISIMEAFNRARNEQSLAHDNPVLNYNESLLIFTHVVGAIRFVEALERPLPVTEQPQESPQSAEEIPF